MSGNQFKDKIKELNNNEKDIINNTDSKRKIKIKIEEIKTKLEVNKDININNGSLKKDNKINNEINKDIKYEEGSNRNNYNINDENKENQNELYQTISSASNYNSSSISKGYVKIKNDVISNKETFPLKIMKYLCYIFAVISIILMICELFQQKAAFNRLNYFLIQHLYFNETKINIGILYSLGVNIRWLSHSLYKDSISHINEEWKEYYKILLERCVSKMDSLKNTVSSEIKEFDEIIKKKYNVEIFFYNLEKKILNLI